MKRLLDSKSHGIADYLAIIALVVMPTLLKFGALGATISYASAATLLLLSAATAYSFGAIKKLSFSIHGVIDFYIGWVLILVSLFVLRGTDRVALAGVGIFTFAAFLSTNFTEPIRVRRAASRKAA